LTRSRSNYDKLGVLADLFADKFDPLNPADEIFISFDEVTGQILKRGEKVPKSVYNFFKDLTRSSRLRGTPDVASGHGYTLVEASGGGSFVRARAGQPVDYGFVPIPRDAQVSEIDSSEIPNLVFPLIRSDEGGLLSAMEYTHLFDRHLGTETGTVRRVQTPVKVQPHEIDGLYAFEIQGRNSLMSVEAKSKGADDLTFEQIYGLAKMTSILYSETQFAVLPFGVKLANDAAIVVVEFAPWSQIDKRPAILRCRKYRLSPTPPLWIK